MEIKRGREISRHHSEKDNEVVCEEIIQCRQGKDVIEYQVNLTSKYRDWREVWVPGHLLPQKSCLTFLQKLYEKDSHHWIFERVKNRIDDRSDKIKQLHAQVNNVHPVEKVLGFLVDNEDTTKLKPQIDRATLDRELAELPSVPNMQICELVAETIDSTQDLRGRYKSTSPVISEQERLNLEVHLNTLSKLEKKMITLSNNIKDEEAKYLYSMTYTDKIEIPAPFENLISGLLKQVIPCTCTGDTCEFEKCEHYKAYDDDGCLKEEYLYFPFKESVHECNSKCKCGPSCANRVVQNGNAVSKEIFSTNGIGLGIRTNEFIRKGTFLGTYAGRLLIRNPKKHLSSDTGKEGMYAFGIFVPFDDSYQFPKSELLTIDASEEGNFMKLVNHSCNPNVVVISVHLECSHPLIHELAFFALRDIQRGEELYIHYGKPYFSDSGMLCRCVEKCSIPHKPFDVDYSLIDVIQDSSFV